METEQAGVAAFAAFIAYFGLLAENRAILQLLQSEQKAKADRQRIHLADLRRERLFVDDNGKEEASTLCHTADGHEPGGSGRVCNEIMKRTFAQWGCRNEGLQMRCGCNGRKTRGACADI